MEKDTLYILMSKSVEEEEGRVWLWRERIWRLAELRGELAKDWSWLEGGSRLRHDLPVTHLLNVGQGQIKWAWGHKTQVILILSSARATLV